MTWYGQSSATGGGGVDPLDKILYDNYFNGVTDGTYIEAGAHDGYYLSTCRAFSEMGWDGINIEPSQLKFELLAKNRQQDINLNYALSDSDGIADFDCTDYDNGSYSHMTDTPSDVAQTILRHHVTTKTLKSIIDKYCERLDLLVLDVEGHEPRVLAGMVGAKVLPKVICVEHSHVGLNTLKPLLPQYTLGYTDWQNACFLLETK